MKIVPSELNGIYIIEPYLHNDSRGFFMESYSEDHLRQFGINYTFIQDNFTLSLKEGTLRGLHFQLKPKAQAKLVMVLTGAVYDVILDIRKASPTYGKWAGYILSETNHKQLLIPEGFAHGYCTLVANTRFYYKVTESYSPALERGLLWNDPVLKIDWPFAHPLLSDKDQVLPLLKDAENNF